MLSKQLKDYAHKCYLEAQRGLGGLKRQVEEDVGLLCDDERTLMELAYGTLPSSDIGGTSFEAIRSYASHAMLLYNTYEAVRGMPEDIFLHYVFYPRINSEMLVDCRGFFYNKLKHVLDINDTCERVLAVNRWCAAQMTYEMSDDRTESPLAAYYSGLGRCGEESVFAVTALRSVGIPARQVYVPWWSHCDDNHAWVEAYVEGRWHFFGACEIEPVLDRGWFTAAVSRALLVHSRDFFDYGADSQQYIGRDGACYIYNQTHRYAKCSRTEVKVFDYEGKPAAGAQVGFYVINMALQAKLAAVTTDAEGMAAINMGWGSVYIEACYKGMYGQAHLRVNAEGNNQVVIDLGEHKIFETKKDIDFIAPSWSAMNPAVLTAGQQIANRMEIEKARKARLKRLDSYWKDEWELYDEDMRKILRLAAGNADNIARFYNSKPDEYKPLAKELLMALSKKDYKDIAEEVLNSHFYGALKLQCKQDSLFVHYVMCPRIGCEGIEDYRGIINRALTSEQKENFIKNPTCLMRYINASYSQKNGRYYKALSMTPSAALSLGEGDEKGRNILFVAIMRTLGVPSRLNPADGKAEYYRAGEFHKADEERAAASYIELVPELEKEFVYASNYTLSKWNGYEYVTLKSLNGTYSLRADEGSYRLITTNRLPSGNQLVRTMDFSLYKDEHKRIELSLRTAKQEDMLEDNPLQEFYLKDDEEKVIPQRGNRLVVYLDLGCEPTEHVLNEMLDCSGTLIEEMSKGLQVMLVLRSPFENTNATFNKVIEKYPHVVVAYDDFEGNPNTLARAMYLEPDKWPLLLLIDNNNHGRFGSCGYLVGLVQLVLGLSKLLLEF